MIGEAKSDEFPNTPGGNAIGHQNTAPAALDGAFGFEIDTIEEKESVVIFERTLMKLADMSIQLLRDLRDDRGAQGVIAQDGLQDLFDAPGRYAC